MYINHGTPNRVLPPAAIELLEALEAEHDRPIMVTAATMNRQPNHAYIDRDRAWRSIDNRLGEPVPQETKDRALTIVIGAGLGGGVFQYIDLLPREALVEGAQQYYYPGGEYLLFNDDYETVSLGTFVRYAELHEDMVCFGVRYADNTWDTVQRNSVDWDKLYGDPVRMVLAEGFAENAAQRRAEAQQAAFQAFMTAGRDAALVQARQRLDHHERNVTEYTAHLSEQLTAARQLSAEIAGIEARLAAEQPDSSFGEQWTAMMAHPRVEHVRLEGEQLILRTDDLHMTHPTTGDTRWIGRFEIKITGRNLRIRLSNLDNPKGGRDHPHVTGGEPCWGAAATAVSQLMSNGDLYALIDLTLIFLQTFNLKDDWGAYASYWFDVPDETPDRLASDSEAPETEEPAAPVALIDDEDDDALVLPDDIFAETI